MSVAFPTADTRDESLRALQEQYRAFQAQDLKLNMARGKPAKAQTDLSRPLLDVLRHDADLLATDGTDCGNYGCLEGIPEARTLMSIMLDADPSNVIVGGGSSLNLMYDSIARYWMFGAFTAQGTSEPWSKLKVVKWLCPVPGYDRHFALLEAFGISMINVPLGQDGPIFDDELRERIAHDPSIKGIWCVPQYSNPTGITYTDEIVSYLASMPCAAKDFRIFWDNAYSVHHLYDDEARRSHVADIAQACQLAGNPHRYVKFASTSKVTFPGAGISGLASSPENIAEIKARMNAQTIGADKLNQLRHARFLPTAQALDEHMRKHARIIEPKFACVRRILRDELDGWGCTWSEPLGGYFICYTGPAGTAKRTVELAKECGVVLTQAGATHPYGNDPDDAVIRIAPTLPQLEELEMALQVFACCAKIAILERFDKSTNRASI